MTAESRDESDLERRIIALEEATMHTERLLARLNEVICEMQDRLDEQTRQLKLMKQSLEQTKDQESEERSFEDERPPHY